ncbi:MAG: DMT family transporter [Lentisphaeraceae bacterium]|nr:DMT family transporter [Lentisphaeraceae bacterium]
MYYLMFAYISFVWGSSFILMKFANACYPPLSLATYRLFGAAAILFVCRHFYKKKQTLQKKDFFPVFLMALSTIVPFAVQPYLINKYGSAFIGMMVIFVPLLTILVSIPIIQRYPVKKEIIGVLGGLAFSWLIVKDGFNREVTFVDILLAFLIPLSYALGNTYTKKRLSHIKAIDLSLYIMLFSGLMLWPFAAFTESVVINEQFNMATFYLIILGIFGTGIPIVIFFFLITTKGPLFAGMVTYIIPVGAILWGAVDSEVITGLQLTAMIGLLFMVALVQWPSKKLKETAASS